MALLTSLPFALGYLAFGVVAAIGFVLAFLSYQTARDEWSLEFEDTARSTSDTSRGSGVSGAERGATSGGSTVSRVPARTASQPATDGASVPASRVTGPVEVAP